jgi:hypothetical protein
MDGLRTLDERLILVNQLETKIGRNETPGKSITALFCRHGFYGGGPRMLEFFLVILRTKTRDIP